MIIHTFVIFCYYPQLCRVAVAAQFNLLSQAMDYTVGSTALTATFSVAAEPSWCSFPALGTLNLYSDSLATTLYSGSTFSISSGVVSVYSTDSALMGTQETIYVTTSSISGWPT